MLPPNVREYLEQLIRVATKGNVTFEEALFVNRLKFRCKKCDMTLTAPAPESATELDYSVQEFIKIHAHLGNHCTHNWVSHTVIRPDDGYLEKTFQCSKCKKIFDSANLVKPTAVTADFKKVPVSNGQIDDKVASASQIQQQMKKYSDELDPAKIEAKAKLIKLQAEIAALNNKVKDTVISSEMSAELILQQKEEQQALQNILSLMELKEKNQKMAGVISGIHRKPEPPKPKPLKQATGRKFR